MDRSAQVSPHLAGVDWGGSGRRPSDHLRPPVSPGPVPYGQQRPHGQHPEYGPYGLVLVDRDMNTAAATEERGTSPGSPGAEGSGTCHAAVGPS
eukprot:8640648-Pyramimonas_sp.AAC.1